MFQGLHFKLRMGSEQHGEVDDVVATGALVVVEEKEEFRTSHTRQLSILLGSHRLAVSSAPTRGIKPTVSSVFPWRESEPSWIIGRRWKKSTGT